MRVREMRQPARSLARKTIHLVRRAMAIPTLRTLHCESLTSVPGLSDILTHKQT